MWTQRKLMKISWTEMKSNKEVINLVQESRKMIKIIETKRIKCFGYNTFI